MGRFPIVSVIRPFERKSEDAISENHANFTSSLCRNAYSAILPTEINVLEVRKLSNIVVTLPLSSRGKMVPQEDTLNSPGRKLGLLLSSLRNLHVLDKGSEGNKRPLEGLTKSSLPRCRVISKSEGNVESKGKVFNSVDPE